MFQYNNIESAVKMAKRRNQNCIFYNDNGFTRPYYVAENQQDVIKLRASFQKITLKEYDDFITPYYDTPQFNNQQVFDYD